jgi:acetyl-CoA synthetase
VLHKLGALMIPATHLLTVRDIEYRVKAVDVKIIIAVTDKRITDVVNEVRKDLSSLENVKRLEQWYIWIQEM